MQHLISLVQSRVSSVSYVLCESDENHVEAKQGGEEETDGLVKDLAAHKLDVKIGTSDVVRSRRGKEDGGPFGTA